jgi:hypothetical protein
MRTTSIDKLLEFIEKENLLPKLEIFLKEKPAKPARFTGIKTLLGTGGTRIDTAERKEKFLAFMKAHEDGADSEKGVHIKEIAMALSGIPYGVEGYQQAKAAIQNWLNEWCKKEDSFVGKVSNEIAEATYYVILPEDDEPQASQVVTTKKPAIKKT